MGTAPNGWQTPKTDWQAGDVPSKDDFNRIEANTQELQDVKAEKADLTSHTGASSPHSGHATVTALNTHTGATSAHNATSAATANRIMMRDAYGRAKVAKPVAGDDVARKDTVDVVQSNLDAHKADGASHAKTARFVVGTSTAGWTEKDCDYLCDGTADQTEINAAITALPATGGEIVILDGTYNITASINIPKNNVSIKGNGNATILKRMYNSTNTDSGATAKGLITLNEKSGCKIQGLQIDGNKATYTASYNYSIYLSSSSNNNTVTGNTCNNNSYGIRLDSSSNNTVTGNTCIRGTGTPEDYTTDQYTIRLSGTGNLISSNNCMGKAVVISGGTGNSAWGNKFDNTDDLP